jgi:hypothetical protein
MTQMSRKPLKGSRRRAAVENLSVPGIQTRMGSLGLYLYAEQFLSAAKSVQAPVETPKFPMARTFLICRTMELALKSTFVAQRVFVAGTERGSVWSRSQELD